MYHFKKLLNNKQIRDADSYTIVHQAIKSIDLMEQASHAFVEAIVQKDLSDKKILVVCGIGNNGGDGFAVARLLKNKGYNISTLLVKFKELLSHDCEKNFLRLENVQILLPNDELPDFSQYDLIVDALLGSGLTKKVSGFLAKVINAVNLSGAKIYAIDLPSGLACDELLPDTIAIKADLCISFQRPKMAFFFQENNDFIKSWEVVNIGLDEAYIQAQNSNYFILDESISKLLKPRKRHAHKGSFGHALLLAGSYGKIGAAVLAAKACLRSGVGLLTTYVPKCGYTIVQSVVPESMCLTDQNEQFISHAPAIEKYQAVGIGPGMGTSIESDHVLKTILETAKHGLVIDADGLNLLSRDPKLLHKLPKNCILSPHPKEFERLVGTASNSIENLQLQLAFSKKYQCILILKGANTSISSPDGQLFFNTTGNPGMATGGSGDVLTGIILGLLAQGYKPLTAALLAVYFHGKAGDEAAIALGQHALIASDIIEHLNFDSV